MGGGTRARRIRAAATAAAAGAVWAPPTVLICRPGKLWKRFVVGYPGYPELEDRSAIRGPGKLCTCRPLRGGTAVRVILGGGCNGWASSIPSCCSVQMRVRRRRDSWQSEDLDWTEGNTSHVIWHESVCLMLSTRRSGESTVHDAADLAPALVCMAPRTGP